MRALILVLSILAIVASADVAKAGLSTTPRETSAPADTATDQATQETEDQIGLTMAKRREVQRDLSRLGFDTKVNGRFDQSTRAVIARWQDEHGYPKTGFLDTAQHKALLDEGATAREASKSDHQDRRRGAGRVHRTRVVGGPIGVLGHAIGGLFRR
jgi:peptidoglycan hydrolase-like protein with peptidoglycan-binding domain